MKQVVFALGMHLSAHPELSHEPLLKAEHDFVTQVWQAQGLLARDAFVVHQYGVAATILSAALRLMRISHVDTQAILYEINAGLEAAYETAAQARLADMASFAPLAEILAAVHGQAQSRLFMS